MLSTLGTSALDAAKFCLGVLLEVITENKDFSRDNFRGYLTNRPTKD
jgi:hypothetical protein